MKENQTSFVQGVQSHVGTYDTIQPGQIIRQCLRRKKLFLCVFGLVVLCSVLYAVYKPRVYQYTRFIQISRYFDGKRVEFLQKPEVVKVQLVNMYIPQVIQHYVNAHKLLWLGMKPRVDLLHDKATLKITSTGTLKSESMQNAIFAQILAKLVSSQTEYFHVFRQTLLRDLNTEKEKLSNFDQNIRLFSSELDYLQHNKTLSDDMVSMDDLDPVVKMSPVQHNQVVDHQSGDLLNNLRSLGFLSNSIRDNSIAMFSRQISKAVSGKLNTKARIDSLQAQLTHFKPTHFIDGMLRSDFPMGISGKHVLLLGLIFGLLLSTLMVYIVNAVVND